ncbi:MAG: DEAD/DEAH box helicase [Synergistaceae bacterium]|nr:DEAD/DEAH box helicase [Synergistaceae bacterium]
MFSIFENNEGENKEQATGQEPITFDMYDLVAPLRRALARKGFTEPMPVQRAVLEQENLLETDIIVQARTGSGKTLAFALPLLNTLNCDEMTPQILVLSPTRELAQQTAHEFAWLSSEMKGKHFPWHARIATLVGGMDIERQIRSLRDGTCIVVGTPGRVLDHIRRGSLNLEDVQTVVLDEGDNMLDMGFRDELEGILTKATNAKRTWLFSATMPEEVYRLSKQYLDAPKRISLVSDVTTHTDITQKAYIIPSHKRFEGLTNVLIWEAPSKALVFCGTKVETQGIAEKLCDMGFKATAIHGDMSQRERSASLSALKAGRVQILVATDVAARGLDIDAVSHVLQFGLPQSLESFVHRSGRTGRAGHEGSNLILLTSREARQFKIMLAQAHSKLRIDWQPAPDATEIDSQARIRFEQNIIENALSTDDFQDWASELLKREELPMIVSGLLAKAYGAEPSGFSIRSDVQAEMDRAKRHQQNDMRDTRKGSSSYIRSNMLNGIRVQFAVGKEDGWDVGRLLGAICRSLGIGRDDVGNIRLRDTSSTVELSHECTELMKRRRQRMIREGLDVADITPITEHQAYSRNRDNSYRSDRSYGKNYAENRSRTFTSQRIVFKRK